MHCIVLLFLLSGYKLLRAVLLLDQLNGNKHKQGNIEHNNLYVILSYHVTYDARTRNMTEGVVNQFLVSLIIIICWQSMATYFICLIILTEVFRPF